MKIARTAAPLIVAIAPPPILRRSLASVRSSLGTPCIDMCAHLRPARANQRERAGTSPRRGERPAITPDGSCAGAVPARASSGGADAPARRDVEGVEVRRDETLPARARSGPVAPGSASRTEVTP